jgi:hypothetical protein
VIKQILVCYYVFKRMSAEWGCLVSPGSRRKYGAALLAACCKRGAGAPERVLVGTGWPRDAPCAVCMKKG